MSAVIGNDDDDVIAEINIIPFVDIVLVLLIIFMLTSVAIAKASLQVDLPRAASAGAGVNSTLNIVFTADKSLYLNGELTSQQGIRDFIKRSLSGIPQLQAVISADTKVPYGEVIEIVDLVKTSGVKSFALNIKNKTKKAVRQ